MTNREQLKLEIRPLIAFRDYHSTTHENGALNSQVETGPGQTTFRPYRDLPALHLAHDPAEIDTNGFWYRNFQYCIEQERGLDFQEDLFSPCAFTFDLSARNKIIIIASTERSNKFVTRLNTAADQFLVARQRGTTVIAGYHWFADWSRDTMISLPGLTLVNGRWEIARSILAEFAAHVNQGMLPNRFPDAGEAPEYNTVDATLWFCEAVRSYLQYTGDYEFVRTSLYTVLKDIVNWHVKGTRYQIHLDHDGLLFSGEPGVQLT